MKYKKHKKKIIRGTAGVIGLAVGSQALVGELNPKKKRGRR